MWNKSKSGQHHAIPESEKVFLLRLVENWRINYGLVNDPNEHRLKWFQSNFMIIFRFFVVFSLLTVFVLIAAIASVTVYYIQVNHSTKSLDPVTFMRKFPTWERFSSFITTNLCNFSIPCCDFNQYSLFHHRISRQYFANTCYKAAWSYQDDTFSGHDCDWRVHIFHSNFLSRTSVADICASSRCRRRLYLHVHLLVIR